MLIDFQRFLTSKPFLTIVAVSAILRLFFYIILLPSFPSSFGPDEGTYATLAKYVSLGLPVQEFPAYGPSLYNSARTLILPSSFLIDLGLNELDAVRLISSTYGLLSSLFLILIVIRLGRLRDNSEFHLIGKTDKKIVFLIAFFAFFPSNFVWSNIGLRESASQFWLITSFYFLINLLNCTRMKALQYGSLLIVSVTLAFGARPETALLFSIVIFLNLVFYTIKYRNYSPILAIAFGIICGQTFTNTPVVKTEITLAAFAKDQSSPESGNNETSSDSSLTKIPNLKISNECTFRNQVLTYESKEYVCEEYKTYTVIENNPVDGLEKKALTAQVLEYKRNVNSLNAQSALPKSSCQLNSTKIEVVLVCNLKEIPFRLVSFLFRPFIFLDQGSTVMKYAALENVVWLLIIPFSFFVTFQISKNSIERKLAIFLLIYVLVFSTAAALYEGNLGTAFRHKSSILWPVVLIFIISHCAPSNVTHPKFSRK